MIDPQALEALASTDAADLLALTYRLCGVPSESRQESALADAIERRLRERASHLDVNRLGDTVIARTQRGHERRVVLGGHLDTVPANGNELPRIEGDTLIGLGAADMKGGLAVMLRLAEESVSDRLRHDVTFVFYEAEEVAEEHNGLRRVFGERPDLAAGDLAILLEPTGVAVEAGCQGTLHVRATYLGARAHSARPWTGVNAVHRASAALARVVAASDGLPEVTVDGLAYRQALQVVRVEGGVANNVVPDRCAITVNRRFAPSVSLEEAKRETEALFADADELDVLNESPAAPPGLHAPLVAEFVGQLDLAVRPKLGWTDAARFATHGVPALNFGPGDPDLAHSAEEAVTREALDGAYGVIGWFLGLDVGTDELEARLRARDLR